MDIFSWIGSIYALDTIDTRFTSPPLNASKDIVSVPSEPTTSTSKRDDSVLSPGVRIDHSGRPIAQSSKWNTPEFYIYYFVFVTVVPYMFWVVYDVSKHSDPNYHKYEHLLSPGWVPGRKIDISDPQYYAFRCNIPYLAMLLILHPMLRSLYNYFRPIPGRTNSQKANMHSVRVSAVEGNARLEQRASFDFIFALIFLPAIHGFSALKILSLLYLNYQISTSLPRKFIPVATWSSNISILFANELFEGYSFAKIAAYMSTIHGEVHAADGLLHSWSGWLDDHGGIIPRWEILFNITVLRQISFSLDYYWSLDQNGGNTAKKNFPDPSDLSERDRIEFPADAKDYCYRNYIAYTIYGPLYLTGPIITFNDYISQLKYPPVSIEKTRTLKYGIRFLLCLLTMELVLHFDYCVAISKGDPLWSDYTPVQVSLLSYFNLHVVWLKLLLPWRLFRLWALIDGIDPPENMLRCTSNNLSSVKFWRGWHRSYNRWLIRYIYVPMGGSSSRSSWKSISESALKFITIFTFVALWHDISLNLLIWGWLIVLFMMPEVVAGILFPRKKWENNLTAYRIICGIGAVGNVIMMMAANLVGFAVGIDGLRSIIYGVFRDYHGTSIPFHEVVKVCGS
ncbi:hypothetical protein BP5796_13169 [Coleophoma crateriformis]|uniref:Uncharacterized protein n=1 Tax=Coleophoma crateriformis TaxID=565419 RepID=A0A3D8Q3Y7_9HELO|nr:hypothetical protein BP5796_13169 [Coleophoma crateriformis]